MAFTIEWKELIWPVMIGAPAAIVSILWLIRFRKERGSFKEAEKCIQHGEYLEAIRHLSQADEKWGFNIANSTPKSVVKDIDRLIQIVEMIADAASRSGAPLQPKGLLQALTERKQIYANKANFKFGTFKLKNEIAIRDNQLNPIINDERSIFCSANTRLLK